MKYQKTEKTKAESKYGFLRQSSFFFFMVSIKHSRALGTGAGNVSCPSKSVLPFSTS